VAIILINLIIVFLSIFLPLSAFSGKPVETWNKLYAFCHEEHLLKYELFDGQVVDLADDTVTVVGRSGLRRTFDVSLPLTSRRVPLEWRCGCGHRLDDVRLGDRIGMDVVKTPRGYTVIAIGIYRRPGGTIPAAEDSHLPDHCRIHNRQNLYQKLEEKGIPKAMAITARIRPGYRQKPEPEQAPEPHFAIPRIPDAQP